MIESLAAWVLGNALLAIPMVAVVCLIRRVWHPPAAAMHFAWCLVLLRLVLPPDFPVAAETLLGVSQHEPLALADTPAPRSTLFVFGGAATQPAFLDDLGKALSRGPGRWVGFALCALWAIGAATCLLREAIRARRISALLRDDARPHPSISRALRRATRRRRRPPPRVLALTGLRVPFALGVLRPTIVVPAHIEELDDAVLLHELAHIERRDALAGWLATCALAIHWWNPLCRLAVRTLRSEAELACDQRVLRELPRGRLAYAESLLAYADHHVEVAGAAAPATGHSARDLAERLRVILHPTQASGRSGLSAILAVALLAMLPASWLTCQLGLQQSAAERSRRGVDQRLLRSYRAPGWSQVLDSTATRPTSALSGRELEARGLALMALEQHERATQEFEEQLARNHAADRALYNLACTSALQEQTERALNYLERAIDRGFAAAAGMEDDPDLARLRDEPRFRRLLEQTQRAAR